MSRARRGRPRFRPMIALHFRDSLRHILPQPSIPAAPLRPGCFGGSPFRPGSPAVTLDNRASIIRQYVIVVSVAQIFQMSSESGDFFKNLHKQRMIFTFFSYYADFPLILRRFYQPRSHRLAKFPHAISYLPCGRILRPDCRRAVRGYRRFHRSAGRLPRRRTPHGRIILFVSSATAVCSAARGIPPARFCVLAASKAEKAEDWSILCLIDIDRLSIQPLAGAKADSRLPARFV